MHEQGQKARRIDRVLDTFASRAGTSLVLGTLVTICICIGLYVNSVVAQLEQNQAIFDDTDARNGYVAMSDVQRMLLIALSAEREGQMSPELAREFANATDVLYVRTEDFRNKMKGKTRKNSGVAAIKSLEELIEIADAAQADGFKDIDGFFNRLLASALEARKHLVMFLDDMNRHYDRLLEDQSEAVLQQKLVLMANLAALTLIMLGALLLLRREVLGRRAREQAEKHVNFLAYFDPLTKLANRTQFQSRLQNALDKGPPFALLYIDLDGFKIINDTFGHDAGDAVLCHVAKRFDEHATAVKGFAARLGGDEFAIVLPMDNLVQISTFCQRILAETEAPFAFEGENFEFGLSIGVATTTQVGSADLSLDLLSRVADFALYASKSSGRGQYTFYNRDLERRYNERRSMLEDLPGAIENDGLEVHMQPKVRMSDGTTFGFEALVRWRRGEELVPPNSFIQIAEESGLVVDIDHYVLRTATKLVADWNRTHGTEFAVSVNLSALNFTSLRITEWVQDALWTSLLEPKLLTLEITETIEMSDWKHAGSVISGLRKLGCKIAIDDFGTGYSSLAYLRRTAADELKIDRSLVMELESSKSARLLMASVLDIARNLNFEVTVEGIETPAQAEIIRNMGAQNGQGFLYSRPLVAETALREASRPHIADKQTSAAGK